MFEMATAEKELLLGTRSNLDITDIDCNDRDAQLCTVYANDIYNNLRVAEVCDDDSVFLIFKYYYYCYCLLSFFLSFGIFAHGQ